MVSEEQIEEQIASGLRSILKEVPSLRVRSTKFDVRTSTGQLDLAIDVTCDKSPWRLIVEVKSSGEPRIARGAIQQLLTIASKQEGKYGLFGAPYVGPETQRLCKELGVGFVDLAGNCRIAFDKTFIERRGLPNPKIERRPLRSLFSPKASRAIRVLFESPNQFWQVQKLARESRVSLGLAAKVKQRLLDLEYAREGSEGTTLGKPEELLRAWANKIVQEKSIVVGVYAPGEPTAIEQALSKFCENEGIRYALTQFSGAARVAPFTRYNRGSAYVDLDPKSVVQRLGWKAVDTGANFALPWPFDDGIWYGTRQVDHDWVVSDIQLFLDLMQSKGRGEEAATSLLEQRLRPSW